MTGCRQSGMRAAREMHLASGRLSIPISPGKIAGVPLLNARVTSRATSFNWRWRLR